MNWLRRMMMGRYGGDQLGIAILIFSMILGFVPYLPVRIFSYLPLAYVLFRMFSRNIYKRRAENERFLKIWYPIKNFFVRLFCGRPDKKTHRHFKCPKCRQEVRVPRGKGTILVTCPKCGEKFKKKT